MTPCDYATLSTISWACRDESLPLRGEEVTILTGAHGAANGSLLADASMLADDVVRFGGTSEFSGV